MARTIPCPREADLLALAVGDEPPPRLLAHLESCPSCRVLVRRLRAEVLCLRSAPDSAAAGLSTGSHANGG